MFNSNFYSIFLKLLPLNLRKENVIAWMKVFISLIKHMKDSFVSYRTEKLFFIAHNSQVIYLEHILNHRFNPDKNLNDANYEGNGIYISDGDDPPRVYLYNKAELKPKKYWYNKAESKPKQYLYNKSEYSVWAGFVVHVPATFNADENEIKALVIRLKLAGKNFTIKTY
ncbi:MAG: hypothetical protein QM503_04490 [Bacteroidota bacterium]